MKKLKTNKSVAKRFRKTSRNKLLRRPTRQDHFNAKTSGKHTRAKRHAKTVGKTEAKRLLAYLPY